MGTMARLNVKVVPGSSRNQIVGWLGDALKIKVMAPPEKGQANEAVIELLAEALDLTTDNIEVLSRHSSPLKVITINEIDDEAIKKSFE
jgi:uncharacterized protein (TIGR00251 family)